MLDELRGMLLVIMSDQALIQAALASVVNDDKMREVLLNRSENIVALVEKKNNESI